MLRAVSKIAAILTLVLLTACGGGGGGTSTGSSGGGGGGGSGGGGGGGPPAVTPLNVSEAGRLLDQASFGATDASIANAQTSDVNGWITAQLNTAPAPTLVSYLDARLIQLRQTNATATLSANQFYEAFFQQAATAPDQLRQRMRFALSQIFVISLADPDIDVRGAGSYYDMLGADAFGNFRTLLEDVTLHPMMGVYLTDLGNQKEDPAGTRTPDENYAREVMQLMTIGLFMLNPDGSLKLDANGQPIPTYGENDIAGLAKVFTGMSWFNPTPTNNTFLGKNLDPNATIKPMIFYPSFHSTSAKTFLGVTIPASATADVAGDLKIALDTIFNHPNVGPFIAKNLIQQFVTSNPSPAYIQRVATVFNNNGSGVRGDMAAVIRAILTDTEARDMSVVSSLTFGKLREPLIRLTNWMRAFNAASQSGNWLMVSTSANTSLEQSTLTSPTVFNFWPPGYVPPNSQLGALNLYAPEFQVVDEVTTASYVNTMQAVIGSGIGTGNDVRSSYTMEIALANDANALVDRMNTLLLYGQMSSTLRQRIVDSVNGIAIPTTGQPQIDAALLNRAKLAVFLTMASPEYLTLR